MNKIDLITGVVAFALIVLMFGAIGGVDNEKLRRRLYLYERREADEKKGA